MPHASLPNPSSDAAYREAGVDLNRAEAVVQIAKRLSQHTKSRALTGSIGLFSGAFELPTGYQQPVLLTGCDGVGTKLKLALEAGIHNTVGIDLVAMNVNDILASGGEPLVFLDYVATGEIQPEQFEAILTGIVAGCQQSGCKLLGGETAEMPGFYPGGEYDLAGFCVGVVEKNQMLPKTDQIKASDVIIGLASSGFHSNGYSLVRHILKQQQINPLTTDFNGASLIEALLAPTRIYVQPVLEALKTFADKPSTHESSPIKAMVHNTGGGFLENIPRVLPNHLQAVVETDTWQVPILFRQFLDWGKLDDLTGYHTWNMGIGFMLIASVENAPEVIQTLNALDPTLKATAIGTLADKEETDAAVVLQQ